MSFSVMVWRIRNSLYNIWQRISTFNEKQKKKKTNKSIIVKIKHYL